MKSEENLVFFQLVAKNLKQFSTVFARHMFGFYEEHKKLWVADGLLTGFEVMEERCTHFLISPWI